MSGIGPKSIRGKVTLAATGATALAMAMVVAITAFAMQQILTGTIAASLDERLDQAQAEIVAGNYQAAIDLAGNEMMQITDANGNVLAETPNARGLAVIADDDDDDDDDDDERRVDKLEFKRSSTSTDSESTAASARIADAAAGSQSQTTTESTTTQRESTAQGGQTQTTTTQSTTTRPARNSTDDDNDDTDDSDDDEDNDNDSYEKSRQQSVSAPVQQASTYDNNDSDDWDNSDDDDNDYDDNDDNDDRNDNAWSAPAPAAPAAAAPAYSDDDDYDNDDDNDNDSDDYEEQSHYAARSTQNTASYGSYDSDNDDYDDDDDDDNASHYASKFIRFPLSSLIRFDVASTSSASGTDGSATSSTSSTAEETTSASAAVSSSTQASNTPAPVKSTQSQPAYVDASDVFGNQGPYLVKKRQIESPDGPVTLAAVASLAEASQIAQLATQLLITLFLALLCLVVAFTWNMAARTLQPVEQMRSTAEQITTSDLSARIPVPERDKDLSRLAQTFNDLLARVEASFNEQRRFVSDASHELKSPVAATSIMLETLREHPEMVDTDQVIADLTTENDRIGSIVGDLLMLARADEGRMKVDAKPVDLMDLLYEEVAALSARSSIKVDTSAVEPIVCQADAELLSHVIRNLLDNAARYAKTVVKVSCTQQDDKVLLTVSDDGPGIAPEDRERVFDRFVCLEDSRSNPNGTGLGLPVARSIAERHGGTLVFTDPELTGATALLTLPN